MGDNKTLSEKDLKLVTFVDQKFWEEGSIPSNDVIRQFFGESFVTNAYLTDKFWTNPVVRSALTMRGIDLTHEKPGALTPEQILSANVMMNMTDKRSTREKLKTLREAGIPVTASQWEGWLREPAFANYLKKRAESMYGHSDHLFYQRLIQRLDEGDPNAMKMFAEMRNIHNPRIDVNINIESMLVRVVEIIARFVGDPDVISAIANEIEALGHGTTIDVPMIEEGTPQLEVATGLQALKGVMNPDNSKQPSSNEGI